MVINKNIKKYGSTILSLVALAGITLGVMKIHPPKVSEQRVWHNKPINLPYRDLASEPVKGCAPERVLYDFGSDSLIVLHDISRDGNYDQLEVTSCRPYRGHDLGKIYMSRELAPNAIEGQKFQLVDQSSFNTFNKFLPEEVPK